MGVERRTLDLPYGISRQHLPGEFRLPRGMGGAVIDSDANTWLRLAGSTGHEQDGYKREQFGTGDFIRVLPGWRA